MNAASNTSNGFARFVLTLAVALAVSAFGVFFAGSQAHAATANAYVGGTTVSKWPAGASWANSSGVCTLTLNGTKITAGNTDSKISTKTGIYITPQSGTNGVTVVSIKLSNNSTITAASGDYAIYNACPNVTLRIIGTGTLTIKGSNTGIYSKGPLEIGANVTIQNCSSRGVKAEAPIVMSGGNLKITEGCTYGITTSSAITTKGGSMSISGAKYAVLAQSSLSINSNISISDCMYGLDAKQDLTISGGTVNVASPTQIGVNSQAANVNISGGTVNVTNYDGHGIQAKGNVNITGGKISATQLVTGSPNLAVAVGDGCTVNNSKAPNCWGTIRGRLDNGATFVKSGSTYKVQSPNNTYATLVKYGGSSTKPSVNKVTFGEASYNIKAIGSKAFKGKKITSVKFGSFVTNIGSQAFYGCKKLKTIDFRKISYPSSLKVGSKAFTKAYAKPTVKVKNSTAKSYVKKQLKKRGLKNAKYKVGR